MRRKDPAASALGRLGGKKDGIARAKALSTHCVITDRREPHRGRGLCHKHYMKWDRDRKAGKEPRIIPLR